MTYESSTIPYLTEHYVPVAQDINDDEDTIDNEPIAVRQAVVSDLEELTQLFDQYRQFQAQPSDLAAARAFLRARFDHGESLLFLAHDGATALGFVQLYPSFSSSPTSQSGAIRKTPPDSLTPATKQRAPASHDPAPTTTSSRTIPTTYST